MLHDFPWIHVNGGGWLYFFQNETHSNM
jgi:hypothetical protein